MRLGLNSTAAPVGNVGEGLYVTLRSPEQIERYIALMQAALDPATGTRSSARAGCSSSVMACASWIRSKRTRRSWRRCKEIYPAGAAQTARPMEML